MHNLAACLDALRRGELAATGDALAARFVALHQSMLDQGWGTARHMEIFPLEDSSAASAAVVLATRRHSRLIQKAQGVQPSTWSGKGRGRGGRGEWGYYGEPKGDQRPEKGKGKKGKGKPKGKDAASGDSWKDKKEKPGDKAE